MVSLPGWGGPWERRERLGSDGSDLAKKRYKLGHPGVHQTYIWFTHGSSCVLCVRCILLWRMVLVDVYLVLMKWTIPLGC